MKIPEPNVPSRAKRSSFANAAGIRETAAPDTTPPPPARPAPVEQVTNPVPEPKPARVTKRAASREADDRKPSKRPTRVATVDILLSVPEEDKQRMVNTIAWTVPRTGIKHQQEFIREAIRRYCTDLEKKFNDGEQFPDVP